MILAVDDDPINCRLVAAICRGEGLEVTIANDGPAALAAFSERTPELVLLDLQLPGMDGFAVLEQLHAKSPDTPVVMLTASTDVKHAVRATQLGAVDYLTKPIDHDELVLVVRRALETRALKFELERLRAKVGETGGLATQMGPSPGVRTIIEQVATVAATSFSVLVLGETGTGKELVAQAIHRQSERRAQPFIALDCGAIPEPLLESELFGHEKGAFTGADRKKAGRFSLAAGGTLFLDEVGNLPMGLQAKLLRVLESRQVTPIGGDRALPLDLRFIAATNDDLQERVTAGAFRADLYFRLAQYTISLPALRERPTDIPYLATRFMEEVRVELRRPVQSISPDALALLGRHDWPGNVRELRNAIRQAVLETTGAEITRATLARHIRAAKTRATAPEVTAGRSLREVADSAAREAERRVICETLRVTRGNKAQAARLLATDYKTLHVKIKNLGIRPRDFA
jgi:DNA-binding NtrC family response regulator